MEVILLEKVPNLGNLGDIVKVKQGYARNYLLPSRLAHRATAQNKADFEAKRAALEAAAKAKLEQAQTEATKIGELSLKLTQKAGVDGRLFGSVTNLDIAQELNKQGYKISKTQVRLPQGHIKTVGDFTVQVSLHTDVVVDVKVTVYGETV